MLKSLRDKAQKSHFFYLWICEALNSQKAHAFRVEKLARRALSLLRAFITEQESMGRKLHQLENFRRINSCREVFVEWKRSVEGSQKERHIRCTVVKYIKEA